MLDDAPCFARIEMIRSTLTETLDYIVQTLSLRTAYHLTVVVHESRVASVKLPLLIAGTGVILSLGTFQTLIKLSEHSWANSTGQQPRLYKLDSSISFIDMSISSAPTHPFPSSPPPSFFHSHPLQPSTDSASMLPVLEGGFSLGRTDFAVLSGVRIFVLRWYR